jgi:1-acyl-sn-glycerol-3-phosphate acyltransferase
MRALLFNLAFWFTSIAFAIGALPVLAIPGRTATAAYIRAYTRTIMGLMRWVVGIRVSVRGRHRLPEGAYILAAKHQSYGDAIIMYSQFHDLAFVTGDHLERFPLVGGILRKLGAIVVDNCGGPDARKALAEAATRAAKENRRILIYPEGHLCPIGTRRRYKLGVYHMAHDFNVQVVPVATNLGLFWPEEKWEKHSGKAVIEFLAPIKVDQGRDAFMSALTDAIEGRTAELVAEARGDAEAIPSVLLPDPPRKPKRADAGVSA